MKILSDHFISVNNQLSFDESYDMTHLFRYIQLFGEQRRNQIQTS